MVLESRESPRGVCMGSAVSLLCVRRVPIVLIILSYKKLLPGR